jgi:hypothetical protein
VAAARRERRSTARVLCWVAVVATAVTTASAVGWILVRLLRPDRESREYLAIAVWSIPLGVLVLLAGKPLRSRLLTRPIARALAGLCAVIAAAVERTFLAVVLTGGDALACDANALWCWTTASLTGMAVDVAWPVSSAAQESRRQAAT